MRSSRTIAAAVVAIGFAVTTIIMLLVEPRMGFRQFSDYLDPAKIVAGLQSVALSVGDLFYLAMGVALAYLAGANDDAYRRIAGVTAAAGIFLIGCLDRILAMVPSVVTDVNRLETAVLGALLVRFAALRLMVFALGVFAWRTSVAEPEHGPTSVTGRTLGLLTLAGSIVFVFAFIPIPLLITLWAIWLTVRYARSASRIPG